jgi:hypothetical protein
MTKTKEHKMTQTLFDFEFDGERYDLECTTKAEAEKWADEWYAERFDDEPMRNGETREDDGIIIEYTYDDETGESVNETRHDFPLEYEYYHGDLKEHGYPY